VGNSSRLSYSLRDLSYERSDANILGETIVIEQHAMAENFGGKVPDVFEGDVRAAFRQRTDSRGADQRLDGAR
jgi:hypothetical protein